MSSVTWYVQSRGTLPEHDYLKWAHVSGDDLPELRSRVLKYSKRWLDGKNLSFVALRLEEPQGGFFAVCMDGLLSRDWPRDHQGRLIRARLIGIVQQEDHDAKESMFHVAAELLDRQEAPADLLEFMPVSPGYNVDAEALLALESWDREPEILVTGEVAWGVAKENLPGYVAGLSKLDESGKSGFLVISSRLLDSPDTRRELQPRITMDSIGEPSTGALPPKPSDRKAGEPGKKGPTPLLWGISIAALLVLLGLILLTLLGKV